MEETKPMTFFVLSTLLAPLDSSVEIKSFNRFVLTVVLRTVTVLYTTVCAFITSKTWANSWRLKSKLASPTGNVEFPYEISDLDCSVTSEPAATNP